MTKQKPSSVSYTRHIVLGVAVAVALAALLNQQDKNHEVAEFDISQLEQEHISEPEYTAEEGLVKWAVDRGARVGFEIRKPNDGERGAYALYDYDVGEEIAAIPVELTIPLENNGGFPAEHTHELIQRMSKNATFLAFFSPYFSTLPLVSQLLTSETFSDELVEGLQSPQLKEMVNRERAIMFAVFKGIYNPSKEETSPYEPIPELLEGEPMFHLQMFAHLTSLISSREFSFHNEDGTQAADRLVPVADMINNNPEKTNVKQFNDGKMLYIRAVRPILAGDELFLPYLPGLDHRNDISLTGYGVVRKMSRPLLPATDLPTFDPESPYLETPKTDDEFYGPNGKYNTEEELARLRNLLDGAAMTLEEDEELIAAGNFEDWKEKMIVEFRIERKRALAQAIANIEKELES